MTLRSRRGTWQSYCVRVAPGAPVGRTELMRLLLADGIATRRGVMAIHREAAYVGAPPIFPTPRPPATTR